MSKDSSVEKSVGKELSIEQDKYLKDLYYDKPYPFLSHTHNQNITGRNWQKKHDWGILRLSRHASSTTKRGAQNMADSRSRRQELVEPEACAT